MNSMLKFVDAGTAFLNMKNFCLLKTHEFILFRDTCCHAHKNFCE